MKPLTLAICLMASLVGWSQSIHDIRYTAIDPRNQIDWTKAFYHDVTAPTAEFSIGTLYSATLNAENVSTTGNITISDDKWIGIGASDERIVFDAAGDISIMGADLGINTTSQSDVKLNVSGGGIRSASVRYTKALEPAAYNDVDNSAYAQVLLYQTAPTAWGGMGCYENGTPWLRPGLVVTNNSGKRILTLLSTSVGLLGIGEGLTPSYPIDATHSTSDTLLRLRSGDDTAKIVLGDNDTTEYIISASDMLSLGRSSTIAAGNLNIVGGYPEKKVCFGTTNPGARLHIVNPRAFHSLRVDDADADTTPFVVDKSGNVGIQTIPSGTAPLEIGNGAGNAIADGWDVYSSIRFKENVRNVTSGTIDEWAVPIKLRMYDLKIPPRPEISQFSDGETISAEEQWQAAISEWKAKARRLAERTNEVGVIAEELPAQFRSKDGRGINLTAFIWRHEMFVQKLVAENKSLRSRVEDLEARVAALEESRR